MKSPGTRSALREFLIACAWLAGILALIFHRSFEADQVLFSNDGPLGLLVAYSDVATSFFKGAWHTLNWIGIKQPSALPNATVGAYFLWGPVAHAKFFTPLALLILGMGAWTFFRQLRFHPAVCTLGALAAVLNTGPFSYACWGLPSLPVTVGATFFAFAALASESQTKLWLRIALAGFALGMAIMEGYDTGAFFSLYVAAFVIFKALTEPGPTGRKLGIGVTRVAVVAICAALLSAAALSTLIGTQIKGIVGTQQDAKTKEQRWDEATQWSLPKTETLRVVIPGLFGYRMDTPEGGNYWGAVGQSPGHPTTRHSGSGVYCGVLVVLVAIWTLAQAGRKSGAAFSDLERRLIWFWGGVALVSLLLAYGRHAPLYQFFYKLPYFSTIRNPIKFMHPLSVALVVLFGYGLQGLYRQYLGRNLLKTSSLIGQLKSWWAVAAPFERQWTTATAVTLGVSALGFLLYLSSQTELRRHLETAGFPGELGAAIARFSVSEVAWFVLFLALSAGAVILIMSGALSGPRVKWAGIVLGAVLLTDFSHANAPWIVYYNYKERYATNPILDILRDKPHEHRVAARLLPMQGMYLTSDESWPEIYQVWLEHLFQYYRIQSLDIIQMPRTPEFDNNFLKSMVPKSPTNLVSIGRLWQLTNTRYILGMRPFLDLMNQQIDPVEKRFRVHTVFGSSNQFALFEYGAALPRAKLYSQWEAVTNTATVANSDQIVLQRLADPAFDPAQLVLMSDPLPAAPANASTNQTQETVTITHYEPKRITLKTEAAAPRVLLLNDRYDPDWKVTVNGEPQPLLRCNYIMRGVYLPGGTHTVEFRYDPPAGTLYVSLAAIVAGLAICGVLMFSKT
ncbi:MAG: YfhO family protein [Verrucomicrobia bacterium]|nr:YfhO family protein [Verrucomicrobiota bacterium]